jgi:distribution and morphology protein 34
MPLAASSGLTIPLQITLSEIKLSAFIILVFSRQKGLTLVFRNDPLESLKVSSTFDSIPFVRDYLQKEIEMQLRTLMMDELPAIIHRLSLRLWCPEYGPKEEEEDAANAQSQEKEEVAIDPFASPPQDAVDARGNVLDANDISSLSLDGGAEIHSLFSQKNLLRLGALNDSHRTLSLFTPSIRDAVFRAWAGPTERGDSVGTSTPVAPSLIRSHSYTPSSSTTYTFGRSSDDGHGHMPSRPSLISMQSATTGLSLGSGRHARSHMRKKKNRVVNLRKPATVDDTASETGESETSSAPVASEPAIPMQTAEEPEDNIITPPRTPSGKVRFRTSSIDLGDSPRKNRISTPIRSALSSKAMPEEAILEPAPVIGNMEPTAPIFSREHRPSMRTSSTVSEKAATPSARPSAPMRNNPFLAPAPVLAEPSPGGIIEQAWMLKMAGEIARRTHDEKAARGFWSSQSQDASEDSPPPAYEPKAL